MRFKIKQKQRWPMLKLGSCVLMETLRYSPDTNQTNNLGWGLWGGFKPKSTLIACPQRLCANSPKDNKWFSVTTAGAGWQVHGIQKCYAGGSIKLLTWTGSWHLWRATWQRPRRKMDIVHGFSVPKLSVWGRVTGTQWRFQTDMILDRTRNH